MKNIVQEIVRTPSSLSYDSIGVSVNNFLRDSKNKIVETKFYDKLKKNYSCVVETKNEILNYEDEISLINKKLLRGEIQIKVRQLQNEKLNIEKDIRDRTEENKNKLIKNKENIKIYNYKKYL